MLNKLTKFIYSHLITIILWILIIFFLILLVNSVFTKKSKKILENLANSSSGSDSSGSSGDDGSSSGYTNDLQEKFNSKSNAKSDKHTKIATKQGNNLKAKFPHIHNN